MGRGRSKGVAMAGREGTAGAASIASMAMATDYTTGRNAYEGGRAEFTE